MPRRREPSWRSRPGDSRRLAVRFVTLFLILALGVYFSFSMGSSADLFGLLPSSPAAPNPGPRRAPFPDLDLLKQAADGQPFLVENDGLLLPSKKNDRGRLDADARYHLLLLAATTPADLLLADAKPVPLADLLREPSAHRGQLLRFEGELLAVKPLELKRDSVAGLAKAYQAVVAGPGLEERLLFLFTDWPAGWPAPEALAKEPPRVAVAGYFLKDVRLPMANDPKQAFTLPALVGRAPLALPAPPSPLAILPWVFGIMAVPVAALLLFAWTWHRGGDRGLKARLAAAAQRQAEQDAAALEAME